MKRSIATLLAAWLLAGAAAAQDMQMHRKQAGEVDGTGLMYAESTGGRFSVKMPIRFDDFTVVETNANSPAERSYIIAARSSERITLVATRVVYRKGAEGAKAYFARLERGEGLGAKPTRLQPRRAGGLPAVDFELRGSADISYRRAILLQSDLIMLTVETPREHDKTAREMVPTFFESLLADPK